jgi:DNA-(apurinic or apyrimidinic site) lyase
MLDSKYNKRLREMKLDRIRKIIPHIKDINLTQLKVFSDDLLSFNKFIADSMKQKIFAKTIVMAVKFFGYANRVVYMRSDNFPMDIDIPLDSRIERIFLEEF